MKNKSFIFIIILCTAISSSSFSQTLNTNRNSTFIENVRFGGGVGLNFGNNFFSGTLAPFALYQVNTYIMSGVGLNMTYASFSNDELFVYGGSIINIINPIEQFQFSVEFEQLRINRSFNDGTLEENYWYPALFLGLGYTSGPVTFGIRYDVLYDEDKSIYANAYMPFVRILF